MTLLALTFLASSAAAEGGYYRGIDGEPYEVKSAGGALSQNILPLFGPTGYLYGKEEKGKGDYWNYILNLARPSVDFGPWPWNNKDKITAFAYSKDRSLLALGSGTGEVILLDAKGKRSIFRAALSKQAVTRLACAGSFIAVSAGGACYLIDTAKGWVSALGEGAWALSILFSENADKLGIISYWDSYEESGTFTTIYSLPSGKTICHLSEEGGRRGLFVGSAKFIIESPVGMSGSNATFRPRYTAFDALTGDFLPVIAREALAFSPMEEQKRKDIPPNLASWSVMGDLAFDDRNMKIPTVDSGAYYYPAPPHLLKARPGNLRPGEGTTLRFDGRKFWLYQALTWKDRTALLFQPSVSYTRGEVKDEGWSYCVAILDKDCVPIALFHNGAGSELPSMAVSGGKLALLNGYSLVEIDLATLQVKSYGIDPQLQGDHEIAGTEDGGIAVVTSDQRAPVAFSIIPPSRDRMLSWKIDATPANYEYAQASVLAAGNDSFVFVYSGSADGASGGSSSIDSSALCLLDTEGRFIDQCSFGGMGIQVPIGASREGGTTKLAFWNVSASITPVCSKLEYKIT